MRVAEGGAEYIRVLETDDIDSALMHLRKSGYQIIHVSHNKQGDPLDKVRLKNKVVFVLSGKFYGKFSDARRYTSAFNARKPN